MVVDVVDRGAEVVVGGSVVEVVDVVVATTELAAGAAVHAATTSARVAIEDRRLTPAG